MQGVYPSLGAAAVAGLVARLDQETPDLAITGTDVTAVLAHVAGRLGVGQSCCRGLGCSKEKR